MHWRRLRLLALNCTILAAGCGDDPPSGSARYADDAGTPDRGRPLADTSELEEEEPAACDPRLGAVGGTALTAFTGGTVDLMVRLATCEGEPIADTRIDFGMQGEAGDSQLLSRSAVTDSAGQASATLRAGDVVGMVVVRASAAGALPVDFSVAIEDAPNGRIEVTVAVSGDALFDTFRAQLFEDAECAAFGPYDLLEPLQTAAPVNTTAAHPAFDGVPVGDGYAVVVLADRDAGLLGYGCTDGVSVAGGQTTPVTVVVGEIPVLFHGVYALQNRFDLSNALPPSVAGTLQLLDELSDDHDVDGNFATEDFGVDPAAFLLDFVYRQFCCWEATGADPDWDSCQAQDFQHPYGDLEDLYVRDFTSWDGAQPIAPFLCGALTLGANEWLQESLQTLIVDSVPDIVLNLVQIAGDMARAFTDMHIDSVLTVRDASVDKTGDFTHVLRTMTVELHDLSGASHTFAFDLAEAGLTNLSYSGETQVEEGHRLIIPEHSFRLDFGALLLYVYRHGLLPLLDCDPDGDGVTEPCTSTGDLFATWVDCGTVGQWLEDHIGWLDAGTYEGLCDTGMTIAGLVVEGEIDASVGAESVITLSGSCQAGALDARRQASELVEGHWDGLLVEDAVEIGPFEGTFSGPRTGDP